MDPSLPPPDSAGIEAWLRQVVRLAGPSASATLNPPASAGPQNGRPATDVGEPCSGTDPDSESGAPPTLPAFGSEPATSEPATSEPATSEPGHL
jgi:hypothetical protein